MSDRERWLALPESMRPIGPKFCPACGKATGTTFAQCQEHAAQCPHRTLGDGAPDQPEPTLSEVAVRELARLRARAERDAVNATLPPKPRLGPAPPPRPTGPLAPDAAWDHYEACLEHFARVVEWGEDYAVGVAVEAVYHALRGVHKAENPRAYGGDPNYV